MVLLLLLLSALAIHHATGEVVHVEFSSLSPAGHTVHHTFSKVGRPLQKLKRSHTPNLASVLPPRRPSSSWGTAETAHTAARNVFLSLRVVASDALRQEGTRALPATPSSQYPHLPPATFSSLSPQGKPLEPSTLPKKAQLLLRTSSRGEVVVNMVQSELFTDAYEEIRC